MSPFWSRKRSSSASDDRRRALVEREQRRYERERDEAEPQASPTETEAEPKSGESAAETKRRPLLPKTAQRTTRKQPAAKPKRRLPLRRRRPRASGSRRGAAAVGGVRSASRSGARATSEGARATVRQAGPGVGRGLARIAALLGLLLALVLRFAALIERVVLAVIDAVVGVGGRLVALGERELTPQRMLVFVIAACGGLLIYSQFVAYRGVEVGQPDYSSVSTIAPAPQTDRVDAGAAHAYVLIPVALLAIGIAVMALVTGRWKLGRLVAVLGVLGVAVSLAIDLPKGLDAGTAGTAFAGARATLTEGFYAQIFSSAVLVLCGLILAAQLRGAKEPAKRGRRGPRSVPGASSLRRAFGRLPRRRRSSPAGGGA